jgi:hypothetical protein
MLAIIKKEFVESPMNTLRLLGAMCACLLSVAVTSVTASVVYEYTGNDFTHDFNGGPTPIGYNPTGAFSLRLELATLLGPSETRSSHDGTLDLISYSYFDGAEWRGSASSHSIWVRGNSTGGISVWDIVFTVSHDPALAGDESSYWRSRDYVSVYDATWTSLCTADDGIKCTDGEIIRSGSNEYKRGVWNVNAVPVPAAAWLFGPGLLGLIGISRRKNAA